jgi:parallel beta-helix repeat protein
LNKDILSKTLALFIIIIFIGVNASSARNIENILNQSKNGNIIYVGGSGPGNYSTIQEGINAASDGDTVFVFDDNSPYNENLIIEKSINLIGEDRNTTIIDACAISSGIRVKSPNVYISRLTIQNSSDYKYSGIRVGKQNFSCYECIFKDHVRGLVINGPGGTIVRNFFINCGIELWSTTKSELKHTIENNTVNDKPIEYYFGKSGLIIQEDPGQIILIDCHNVLIKGNIISNTSIAIHIFFSSNIIVTNNHIVDIKNDGMLLYRSDYVIITRNLFSRCDWGAIWIYRSNKNLISQNNFIDNTRDVKFSRSFRNKYYNNYWDEWIGLKFEILKFLPKKVPGWFFDFIPQIFETNLHTMYKFDRNPAKEPFVI